MKSKILPNMSMKMDWFPIISPLFQWIYIIYIYIYKWICTFPGIWILSYHSKVVSSRCFPRSWVIPDLSLLWLCPVLRKRGARKSGGKWSPLEHASNGTLVRFFGISETVGEVFVEACSSFFRFQAIQMRKMMHSFGRLWSGQPSRRHGIDTWQGSKVI